MSRYNSDYNSKLDFLIEKIEDIRETLEGVKLNKSRDEVKNMYNIIDSQLLYLNNCKEFKIKSFLNYHKKVFKLNISMSIFCIRLNLACKAYKKFKANYERGI